MSKQARPDIDAGLDLLTLVLSDALQGIDIKEKYPEFYREMLADSHLRNEFLAGLDLLSHQQALDPDRFPNSSWESLRFLKASGGLPGVVRQIAGKQSALWHLFAGQINALFKATEAGLAWRSAEDSLEPRSYPLLRSQVEIDGVHYAFRLEASESTRQAQAVDLNLLMGITPMDLDRPTRYRVHLRWGAYDEAIAGSSSGWVRLPAVPLPSVFDEAGGFFTADIDFSLEPI
jgi:hypothetical protein